jgi:hypothetical protein
LTRSAWLLRLVLLLLARAYWLLALLQELQVQA